MLRNDIRFLSSNLKNINDKRKKIDLIQDFINPRKLKRYDILEQQALEQGIQFQKMPNIFEKHRRNISFYFMKEKSIFWNFDINFVYFDKLNIQKSFTILTNPISDNNELNCLISTIDFCNVDLIQFFNGKISQDQFMNEVIQNDLLLYFVEGKKLAEINQENLNQKIKEFMNKKIVTEYPEIVIIKKNDQNKIQIENFNLNLKTNKRLNQICKVQSKFHRNQIKFFV